ncbi:MAG: rhomboid family intramembrane serine protease [Flavobacteriales bacterium]
MLSNLLRNIPPITLNLIIINALLFFGIQTFPQFSEMLALHYFDSPFFKPFQVVTHMFMHANFTHLFFNMFALGMFGAQLERELKAKRFLMVYFTAGIGAFLLHYAAIWYQLSDVTPEIMGFLQTEGADSLMSGRNYVDPFLAEKNLALNTPMVGASGAIMGLLAAFAYVFPNVEIYLYFAIPIKAKFLMPIVILFELYLGTQNFQYDNVAHWAHIGGAITGLILVYIWSKQRNRY